MSRERKVKQSCRYLSLMIPRPSGKNRGCRESFRGEEGGSFKELVGRLGISSKRWRGSPVLATVQFVLYALIHVV